MKDERKPLREWMLARHADAAPKLDALRVRVVVQAEASHHTRSAKNRVSQVIAEIIAPSRVFWKGLGLAWVAIVLIYVTVGHPGPVTKTLPQSSPVAFWFCGNGTYENLLDTLR